MKRTTLNLVLAFLMAGALGCGSDIKVGSKTETNAGSATGTATTVTTTGTATDTGGTLTVTAAATATASSANTATNAGTATAATDTITPTGTGTGTNTQACTPSADPHPCACKGDQFGQTSGFQFCEIDGTRYTVCVCPPGAGSPPPGGTTITVTQTLPTNDAPCPDNGVSYDTGQTIVCGSGVGECHQGTKTCVNGSWTPCAGSIGPTPEVCDGKDNDCDGQTDEDFPVGVACNGLGICVGGVYECASDHKSVICSVAPNGSHDKSKSEDCSDLLDNDCNGVVNNGCKCTDGDVKACGPTDAKGALMILGECRIGQVTCAGGVWPEKCDANVANKAVYPTVEVCDGKDNDCNGVVDDLWDTSNDPNNCGKCGNVCAYKNATALCVADNCQMGKCDPFFYDVDKDLNNGCEYACLSSTNGVRACDHHDNDCDGKPDDTEWNLETDPKNCGVCGNDCSFSNLGFDRHVAIDACIKNKCTIAHCLPGWIDLNNNPADGCEAALLNTDGGAGGGTGTGGSTATGGSIGSGGVSGAGGISASGGTNGNGGVSAGGSAAGGTIGTGGNLGSGGVIGGAGTSGTGGASSAGGTSVSSFDAGVGGIGGSGGSGESSSPDAAVDSNGGADKSAVDAGDGGNADGESIDGEVTDGGVIYSPEWGAPPLSQGTITCTREGPHVRVEIAVTGLLADGLAGSPPISQAYAGAGIGADLDSCWTSLCYHKATTASPIVWSDNLALTNNNAPLVADGIQPTKFTPYVITATGERIYLGLRSWTIIGCVREGCGLRRPGEFWEPELIPWGCIADATSSP
jgi:Putative metal-binding motif